MICLSLTVLGVLVVNSRGWTLPCSSLISYYISTMYLELNMENINPCTHAVEPKKFHVIFICCFATVVQFMNMTWKVLSCLRSIYSRYQDYEFNFNIAGIPVLREHPKSHRKWSLKTGDLQIELYQYLSMAKHRRKVIDNSLLRQIITYTVFVCLEAHCA